MQDKWDVKNKKGYLKIHVAVNKDQRNSCIKLQMRRYMMKGYKELGGRCVE